MQASVIISYYKNIPNLSMVLLALNHQTAEGTFEVIISEDDNAPETLAHLEVNMATCSFPVRLISQEDKGFRKCRMLNKAIAFASADFIIFIDGDCIPHERFVEQYIINKKKARVLYGRRVMLSELFSKELLQKKDLALLNIRNLLKAGCTRIEEGFFLPWLPQLLIKKTEARLLGCNMGLYKDDLVAINGFDEDYTTPGGGEDSDIEWRIQSLKQVTFYSMKFNAIVYHIWHPERFTDERGKESYRNLLHKMEQGFVVCKNGITKL